MHKISVNSINAQPILHPAKLD